MWTVSERCENWGEQNGPFGSSALTTVAGGTFCDLY